MCVCVYVTIWPPNANKHLPFRCTSSGTVARRPLGCPKGLVCRWSPASNSATHLFAPAEGFAVERI